jgi:hypothetical protein
MAAHEPIMIVPELALALAPGIVLPVGYRVTLSAVYPAFRVLSVLIVAALFWFWGFVVRLWLLLVCLLQLQCWSLIAKVFVTALILDMVVSSAVSHC